MAGHNTVRYKKVPKLVTGKTKTTEILCLWHLLSLSPQCPTRDVSLILAVVPVKCELPQRWLPVLGLDPSLKVEKGCGGTAEGLISPIQNCFEV